MTSQRTSGMHTVGTLNIVFGALFGIIGLLMAYGGAFMDAPSANAGGTPGEFIRLIGIASAAINVLLLAGGIGVLRVAAWGRTLSVAYGGLGVIVYGASLVGGGLDPFFAAALAYSVVLIILFYTAEWKVAFGKVTAQPVTAEVAVTGPAAPDGAREAA